MAAWRWLMTVHEPQMQWFLSKVRQIQAIAIEIQRRTRKRFIWYSSGHKQPPSSCMSATLWVHPAIGWESHENLTGAAGAHQFWSSTNPPQLERSYSFVSAWSVAADHDMPHRFHEKLSPQPVGDNLGVTNILFRHQQGRIIFLPTNRRISGLYSWHLLTYTHTSFLQKV